MAYSGCSVEQLLEASAIRSVKKLLGQLGFTGRRAVIMAEKNIELRFRGSANQRALDVPGKMRWRRMRLYLGGDSIRARGWSLGQTSGNPRADAAVPDSVLRHMRFTLRRRAQTQGESPEGQEKGARGYDLGTPCKSSAPLINNAHDTQ